MEEEIKYTFLGDVRDVDYDGEVWTSLFECSLCGAAIRLTFGNESTRHTEWHRKLEEFYPNPDVQITVREAE